MLTTLSRLVLLSLLATGSIACGGTTRRGGDADADGDADVECGDGQIGPGEECDDANASNTDSCLDTCMTASCGDGYVQARVEACDDGNGSDSDDCLNDCTVAFCGDGFVRAGVEACDDANAALWDGCRADCTSECGNPGGGTAIADNGTRLYEYYCFTPGDDDQTLARKACESHFGEGNCCVIEDGYQGQQYGECNAGGDDGTIHWHWDNHPEGHCEPNYVVGDVVSAGWCGTVLGNFLPRSCADDPQWQRVACATDQWVWSSDRAVAQDLATANARRVLWTGCSHAAVDGCSLDGTGWISTATQAMAGCDASWYHIGGAFSGDCGGHDGDVVRHLVHGDYNCYAY